MAASEPQTFRIPLVLLAAVNLAVLGVLLWPWQEALNLPVGGTTAIDPAVSLLAYIGIIFWIGGSNNKSTRKALFSGAILGLAAGLVVAVRVIVDVRVGAQSGYLQFALLGLAAILWGIAGLRGSQAAGNAGIGALSGMWSAMVSGLMACAAILAEFYLGGPTANSPDLWKQYQGLAIGNLATQGLVHALDSSTAFLLLGPLVGAVVGFVFAFFGQGRNG
jgi:hypothetical protein